MEAGLECQTRSRSLLCNSLLFLSIFHISYIVPFADKLNMIELNFIFNLKRNKLFAINFWQGIIVTGVTYYLQAWVLEKKGPVFLAMSTPLALIMTMFSSAILLGEIITLGR